MPFAAMNLNPDVLKGLPAGYTKPTPIQARSIPEILKGNDIVASAQTGTGKTLAFLLPALHRLTLKKSNSRPRVLILTPTRELAEQITKAANIYGKFLNFNIISLVGGMPYRQQLRDLSRPVDIIVATPGRLLDHMDNKRLNLSEIEMLILDEADRMLDISFFEVVKEISKATPATRQTLLFSATVEDKLARVISTLLKNPIEINLSEEVRAPAKIKQEIYLADNSQHKMRLLTHFIENENIYKSIIFSATKVHADLLAKQLRDLGYEAAALHGDLKQQVRNKTVEKLRQGKLQFIVATDVAARGIDINDVTHVINYDLPKFSEDYVHRIGRTGRAGKEGVAISLVLPLDARHLQKIERYIGEKLPLSEIEGLAPTKRLAKSNTNPNPKKKSFGKGGGRGGFRESYSRDRDYTARKPAGKSRDGDSFAARSSKPRAERFAKPRGESFGGERSDRSGRPAFGGERSDRPARPAFGGERSERASRPAFGVREDRPGRPRGESFGKPRSEVFGGGRGGDERLQRPRGESFGKPRGEDRPSRPRGESPGRSGGREQHRAGKPREEFFAKPREERAHKPREGYYDKPARTSDRTPRDDRSGNPRISYARDNAAPRGRFGGNKGRKPRPAGAGFSRNDDSAGRRSRNDDSRGSFKKNKTGKNVTRATDGF